MEKTTTGKKKQNNEYFREYYRKNKERISARNKAKYRADRSDPVKLKKHIERATEATRRWRAKHPGKVKKQRKQVYEKRKYRAFEMVSKTGNVECESCGCDEITFLEINHINGGGCQEHKQSSRIATMDRILKGERETNDLNLLCRLCNAHHHLESKNPEQAKRLVVTWGSV